MAKIAGRKNDGAWYRFNTWIVNQPSTVQGAFSTQLANCPSIAYAFDIITQYITATGAARAGFPSDVTAWVSELSVGVPRQIWEGVTTYDSYSLVGDKYVKLMQVGVFTFSKDVRKISKLIRFSTEEVHHLAGLTHPTPSVALAYRRQADENPRQYKARRKAELVEYLATHQPFLDAIEKIRLTSSGNETKAPELRPRTSQPKGRSRAASVAS